MIAQIDLLMEKFDKLEAFLSEFNTLTERLSGTDLEMTDLTQDVLNEREKVIDGIKELRPQIVEIIDAQTPGQAELIRKMLNGEVIMSRFSEDEKNLQGKIINITSLQGDIMKKEAENKMRYRRKYDEIREELENLQREKKKLSFYQNAKMDEKGAKFEANS